MGLEMIPIESLIEEPQFAIGKPLGEGGPIGQPEPQDLFAMQLTYDVGNPTLSAIPQLNGNIATMSWQVACNNIQRYGFNYDYQDRVTASRYAETDVTNANYVNFNRYDLTKVDYDQRGNITRLFRRGHITGNYYSFIDYLRYNYAGNQLTSLFENTSTNAKFNGFTSDDGGHQNYSYDANGNMTSDEHHDISLIEYNHLNLPKKINYQNGNWIKWTYDSAGNKLKKETSSGVNKNYLGGIEYKDGLTLEAIYHSDGRAVPNGEADFRYEYTIGDHLGNTRVTFADLNDNQAVDETEILQENHYYPFGMQMEGSWSNFAPNKYQYNGKELNEDFGLNWLDYGARFYDPALARWGAVDLLSDHPNQIDKSPYAYAWNNPILLDDPDGNCPSCVGALIGVAIDYASQVTVNLIQGDNLGTALTDINVTSLAVSAGAGAVGVGIAQGVKNFGKGAQLALQAGSDAAVSVASQAINEGEVSAAKVGADALIGTTARVAIGAKAAKSATNSQKGGTLTNKVAEQMNISRGKSRVQGQKKTSAGVTSAENNLGNYKSGKAAVSSSAAAGSVRKVVSESTQNQSTDDYINSLYENE